eukprot:11703-Heterococcus_DN1.PRE.2
MLQLTLTTLQLTSSELQCTHADTAAQQDSQQYTYNLRLKLPERAALAQTGDVFRVQCHIVYENTL